MSSFDLPATDDVVDPKKERPQTLVGMSFPTKVRAQEFLVVVTGMAAEQKVRLRDAVVVLSDADGKTTVQETIDPTPGRAALSGSMWAGLFGLLLGGPVGWVAGLAIGAGAGAVTAKIVDLGIPDEWVAWFRENVQPNTTTLALLLEDVNREAFITEAQRFAGAKLIYANLDEATMDRIRGAFGETVLSPPSHPESSLPSDV